MPKTLRKLHLLVVSILTLLLLVACRNSADNDITGTWIANHSYGELEIVVAENEFELSINYTKQGWLSSSDETMTLLRGQVKPSSKKLEVESVTSEFLELIGVGDDEEVNPKELQMTYSKSGTTLIVNVDGSEITFNKNIKGDSTNEKND